MWESFSQEIINRLVLTFENGIKLLIQKNGKTITHKIYRNFHTELIGEIVIDENFSKVDYCPIEFLTKRPYTIHEDLSLLYLVSQRENKWEEFANLFKKNRTHKMLSSHYSKIMKAH